MATAARAANVFVNCPFDPAYQPLLDAIVFAITTCNYNVRSALEVADSGDLRLRKIIALIEQSEFSIHDISRVGLDAATGLPRFNMPIELGIALGMKHLGRSSLRRHQMLILDKEGYRYRDSASDLAGLENAYTAFQSQLPKMAADAKQTLSKLTYVDRLRHLSAFLEKAK